MPEQFKAKFYEPLRLNKLTSGGYAVEYFPQIFRILTPVLFLLFIAGIAYFGRRIKRK